MAASKELIELYELVLESPGLSDTVKLDSRITSRTALFAIMALEYALGGDAAVGQFQWAPYRSGALSFGIVAFIIGR